MADRAEDNKVPARNAPNLDQEPQRSRGPDDHPAPPHRGEMNRKTVPDHESAAPSWPAPVANRITTTESPTKKACNGLLQQNRPKADIEELPGNVRFRGKSRHRNLTASCPLVTDAVEKVFLGVRENFYRGAG